MRLLLLAILAYIAYRLLKAALSPRRGSSENGPAGAIDEMVQDPQCGTYIPLREATRKVIGGREYFFCSEECAGKFQQDRE